MSVMAAPQQYDEKFSETDEHAERINSPETKTPAPKAPQVAVYENEEEEPELHWRTWVAIATLLVLNFTQLFALSGVSTILSFLAVDVNGVAQATWVPNALNLVQAVGGPIFAFTSDVFQARKWCILIPCCISVIGAAIAPGANDIYRVIGAQILIGVGFSVTPLSYAIPSEIVPRRWRPITQAAVTIGGNFGGISSPLIAGALTRASAHQGWRNYFYIQIGLWAITAIGIYFGYRPPKRPSRVADFTLMQKLRCLDIPGMSIIAAGLSFLLAGLTLGNAPWPWSNARVVAPITLGCIFLVVFATYEWKATKVGILDHRLFAKDRNFAILIFLMFLDGGMAFVHAVFYPNMTVSIYETNALKLALRVTAFKFAAIPAAAIYGWISTRYKIIRPLLIISFSIWVGALIGLSCLQPSSNIMVIAMQALAGLGFGGPLVLVISGVQLTTPSDLIATATAVTTSCRAIGGGVFTAVYGAILTNRRAKLLPTAVGKAAAASGLAPASIPGFVRALVTNNRAAVAATPGINPTILSASMAALKQAQADSFRPLYITALALGVVAIILCFFLTGNLTDSMHYRVDAPMEELHSKKEHHHAREPNA